MQSSLGPTFNASPLLGTAHPRHEGLIGTLAATKNWFVQLGVTIGTDTAAWNLGQTVPNPFPNPVYPDSLDANAFNGDTDACPASANCKVSAIAPDKNFAWIASMDLILHF